MTIQQLEYILAVDQFRHFATGSGILPCDAAHAECYDPETGR